MQEYIVKKDEHPIEGISLNEGEDIRMFIKSVNYRLTKDSFGIYRHLEPFNDADLEEKIKKFIRKIHYTGVFEIEFIVDQNDVWCFLETNFRITQFNYAYTKFGVNFAFLYSNSVLNGLDTLDELSLSTKRPFNVMSEFEDLKYSVFQGQLSLFEWMKDVLRTDCFSFYTSNDLKPFIGTVLSKFLNLFRSF